MCKDINDIETYRVLLKVFNDELDLYEPEELPQMIKLSMMMFSKSWIVGAFKNLDK